MPHPPAAATATATATAPLASSGSAAAEARANGGANAAPSRHHRWRYDPATKRDLRYDFLRGLAVIAMVTDHIGGQQSLLYLFTGANHFFVSAAEVFVFISGLVFGIVEVSLINRQGIEAALSKALRRVGVLYGFTTGLTLAFALVSAILGLAWVPKIAPGGEIDWLISVLTLHRAYYLTDVLLLYVLLVLVSGLALLLMEYGYTWLVLAGSWGLWLLWQVSPQHAAFPWPIADNPVFNFPAWQVLFLNGLVVGFYRKRIAQWLAGRVSLWAALIVSGGLFAGLIALYLAGLAPLVALTGRDADTLRAMLFSKDDQSIGRLIAFAVFMAFAFSLLTVLWQPLERALGWLILPLGSHALGAYTTHLFVVAVVTKVMLAFPEAGADLPGTLVTTAAQVVGIAIVWGVIKSQPAFAALGARLRSKNVLSTEY